METVAAESDAALVWFFARAGLSAPDREQTEHQTFVGYAIEIVELAGNFVVGPFGIERIRTDPERRVLRLARFAPVRAFCQGLDFPITAGARVTPSLPSPVDPAF